MCGYLRGMCRAMWNAAWQHLWTMRQGLPGVCRPAKWFCISGIAWFKMTALQAWSGFSDFISYQSFSAVFIPYRLFNNNQIAGVFYISVAGSFKLPIHKIAIYHSFFKSLVALTTIVCFFIKPLQAEHIATEALKCKKRIAVPQGRLYKIIGPFKCTVKNIAANRPLSLFFVWI